MSRKGNGTGKTAKEMGFLSRSGRPAIPTKYAKPPGYMKSQNGEVRVIKKANKQNTEVK